MRANLARTDPALPWGRVTCKFVLFNFFSCAASYLYLAPDAPHSGLLSLSGDGGLVLGLVDIGAPLTHIPPGLVLVGRALNIIQ